jgi:hypothetical protein
MRNPFITIGILLFMSGVFLPWGPAGTDLETGFNEEGSPGLIGMLTGLISLYFANKTTQKSYYILIILGILSALYPVTLFNKIFESSNSDIGAVKYGVYIMLISAIMVITGSIKGLKKAKIQSSTE